MKPMSLVASMFTALTALTALAGLPGAAAADVTVMDNDKTLEVDCAADPTVSLMGNHITVTLKGVCARLVVTGNDATVTGSVTEVSVAGNKNTITLAAADDVSVTGNDNTVAVAKAIKRKAPRVSNVGNHNKVTRPK